MIPPPRPTRALHTPHSDAYHRNCQQGRSAPSGHQRRRAGKERHALPHTQTTAHPRRPHRRPPGQSPRNALPAVRGPRHLAHESGALAHHPPRGGIGDARAHERPRTRPAHPAPHPQLLCGTLRRPECHAHVVRGRHALACRHRPGRRSYRLPRLSLPSALSRANLRGAGRERGPSRNRHLDGARGGRGCPHSDGA